jgi:hypothetical protein
MRLLALTGLIALVGASCAAGPEVVTTASEPAAAADPQAEAAQELDETVAEQPGTAPETPSVPGPAPETPPDLGPDVVEVPEAQGWYASPFAIHVPDASEIGADWIVNNGHVTEYEAPMPNEELAACGLTEPPTLEGLEVTYNAPGDYDNTVEFIVNRGTGADAQSFLDVFRGMAECDPDTLGFAGEAIDITTETIIVEGADDAIVTRFVGQPEAQNLEFAFVVVRYGELLLAMSSGDILGESTTGRLSVDEMLAIIERAAGRG